MCVRPMYELADVERPRPYALCVDADGTIVDFADPTGLSNIMGITLKKDDLGRLKLLNYLERWPLPQTMRAELERHCQALVSEGKPFELHADIQTQAGELHIHLCGQRCVSGQICLQVRDESSLTHVKRQLDEALNSYRQSIGLVAHEFRSPLLTIGGFARILLRTCTEPNQQEMLRTIITSVENLEEIVEVFLNAYRIETASLVVEKKEVDVYKDVIAPALADVAHLAVEAQVVIDHNASLRAGEVIICTDPHCLKTVYRNLFANAIRYGGQRARVAYGIEDAGDVYKFNVWNSGSGIPPEDIPRLFKRFSRLEAHKHQVKGTGLGLYNAKGIIEALGGKIWAESDGRTYVNFLFTLPKR